MYRRGLWLFFFWPWVLLRLWTVTLPWMVIKAVYIAWVQVSSVGREVRMGWGRYGTLAYAQLVACAYGLRGAVLQRSSVKCTPYMTVVSS